MIFTIFFAAPLLFGTVAEYGVCRFPKRRFWRWLPPAVFLAAGIIVTLSRYYGWSQTEEKAPLETLLFFPGLPVLGLFLGCAAGWQLYKSLWYPKVVKRKRLK